MGNGLKPVVSLVDNRKQVNCNTGDYKKSAHTDKKQKTCRVGPPKSPGLDDESQDEQEGCCPEFAMQAGGGFTHSFVPFHIFVLFWCSTLWIVLWHVRQDISLPVS
jgi:hypothetical protein